MTSTTNTTWNAHLYDDKHAFVFKFGEDLVDLLAPLPGESILDLGCGTGYLTQLISQSGATVTGVDNSRDMIAKAQSSYPELEFRVASATELRLAEPASRHGASPSQHLFDAVFSNAVLHWVLDKEAAIDAIYRVLRPGGRLVLEMGGKDNVEAILSVARMILTRHGYSKNAATQPWYFPSLGEYTTRLENRGFRIGFASHYDRETKLQDNDNGIVDWIRMFGNSFFKGIPATALDNILEEIQETLRPTHYRDHAWWADYKRLRIVATKQDTASPNK